ncbi:MYXO-CTERM sorting domain-containing protein [Nannocystis punicea]|uniref:MYXO-CTERM sorting domain-containing protein n=1 Tax=Nannocystis punicea TaxID=2995304 RepID=A0ABY7HK42_9BACT|nr:MYXO-CTERM sorting domain-containing protein [Nannocystis poenicansa]WAS99304.1 MYXO-CTERM sorting domain-containing protein [Nannocystis poenicansa]
MPRLWLFLPLILLGVPTARAEVAVSAFSPLHERQLVGLDDFSFDSDWFPNDSPVQLRLIVHAGNSVMISMPGEAEYDWASETIRFTGAADAGQVGFDIGFQIDSKIRFDVLGVQWESDILGPYDYAVIAGETFTPYLLEGNPERPVTIDDETDPATVVSVPVTPDVLIAAGNLDIDAYVILHGSLAGQSIEVRAEEPAPQLAIVTEEGEAVSFLAGPGPAPDPLTADGVLVCDFATTPTIVLKPTLVMEIFGQDYEIADIEIPITLPAFDETIRFDPIALGFPRPPPEAVTTGSDSEGDSHGMSGGDEPTTTGDSTSSGSSGTGELEDSDSDSGGAGLGDDDGCSCRSDGTAPPLAALALLGLRRRRRSDRA